MDRFSASERAAVYDSGRPGQADEYDDRYEYYQLPPASERRQGCNSCHPSMPQPQLDREFRQSNEYNYYRQYYQDGDSRSTFNQYLPEPYQYHQQIRQSPSGYGQFNYGQDYIPPYPYPDQYGERRYHDEPAPPPIVIIQEPERQHKVGHAAGRVAGFLLAALGSVNFGFQNRHGGFHIGQYAYGWNRAYNYSPWGGGYGSWNGGYNDWGRAYPRWNNAHCGWSGGYGNWHSQYRRIYTPWGY